MLAVASAWVTAHHQPQSEVESYKKFLRDHGEKLTIDELLPTPTPAASNSLDTVQSAFALFGSGSEDIPAAMKMVAPGRAMVGWRQPLACGYEFTNSWEDFSAKVSLNLPAIELLHQVRERPKLDFQLDYKKGAELLLPHLMQLKKATQKLDAAAIYQLHSGETGAATTNILTMLALVQRNAGEGVLISHFVRRALIGIAVAPTWELLQATNVTDPELAAIQQAWSTLDFISDSTNVFALERAWSINFIQKMRASREELFSLASLSSSSGSSGSFWDWPPDWEAFTEKPRDAIGTAMWRSSWSYTEELRMLKSNQIILETLRAMQTNHSQFYKADCGRMWKRLASINITNAGSAFFHALKISSPSEICGNDDWNLGKTVDNLVRMEVANRVIATAVALKRFQLKHGKLPEALDELAPEFFPSVLIDPYDGKPLCYHPNVDGTYLLYCVGENGVDDGGDPSLPPGSTSQSFYWQGNKARDWVWPQPATADEIQYFYEHPPK